MSKDIENKFNVKTKSIKCEAVGSADYLKFERAAHEWLKLKETELKLSSTVKYANIIVHYLIPEFGERDIEIITRDDIWRFSGSLLEHGSADSLGLSPKTVNCILSVLKNIFAYYAREKYAAVADIKDISVKQPQKTMRILSRSEQAAVSDFLCSNPTPCHLGVLLSLYTGLRIGEICALKWGDINFSEKYVYVHNTMQRIQTLSDTGGKTQVIIMPPKSECSIRRIPIPTKIIPLLARSRQQPDSFLLTGRNDRYIEPRCMENHFGRIKQYCGISDINFHALRHTFATRCIELGFDIKSLSEILGHASVNITLNRYVHPSMELKRENMDKLCALLNG